MPVMLGVTMLLGFVVAIVPVFPIEPYVIGMAATTHGWAIPIGLAAGLGQAAGKTVVLVGARGAVKAAWIQRFASRWSRPPTSSGRFIRRVSAGLDRPVWAAPIVFVAAGAGIPPLAIVVFYAAKTRMSWLLFFLVALAGRSIYFTAIALVPSLFLG
ncbi:hypothetical protein [Rhizocola hellebori]|uniref:hypothetical protein n=1 Tax=Rhizocola hellebori TaxID=1392758 RepID=UPI0019404D98|nr:hypothetical protein [Rhizocola hellebori]